LKEREIIEVAKKNSRVGFKNKFPERLSSMGTAGRHRRPEGLAGFQAGVPQARRNRGTKRKPRNPLNKQTSAEGCRKSVDRH